MNIKLTVEETTTALILGLRQQGLIRPDQDAFVKWTTGFGSMQVEVQITQKGGVSRATPERK